MSNSANQDHLDMHRKITEKVNEQAAKVRIEVPTEAEFLQEQVNNKIPITSAVNVQIPSDEFLEFAEEIANIIKTHQPQLEETVSAIIKTLHTTDKLDDFIEASKRLDVDYFQNFGEENKINGAILQFLGEMAYRSYVKMFASIVNPKIDIVEYRSNHCPACGEKVRVMRDINDEKWEACCTRCDTVWNLNRLHCPHCNNDDQRSLRYIKAGSEEERKVYACDVCKGYVKYVDMQKTVGKPSFFLVDLETIYLDMLAAQQGFGAEEE